MAVGETRHRSTRTQEAECEWLRRDAAFPRRETRSPELSLVAAHGGAARGGWPTSIITITITTQAHTLGLAHRRRHHHAGTHAGPRNSHGAGLVTAPGPALLLASPLSLCSAARQGPSTESIKDRRAS
jgi:hypothetical protein